MAALTAAQSKKISCGRRLDGHSSLVTDGPRTDSAFNVLFMDSIEAAGTGQTTVVQHTRRCFFGFVPPTASDYANAHIGDIYCEFASDTTLTSPYDYSEYVYGVNGWVSTSGTAKKILDPGNAGAIPVTASGSVPLVTGGAETRTLADASYPGQILNLYLKTDGGDCVVTSASPINQTGNNTMTFADVGDQLVLMAVEDGADIEWRVLANDGVALTTV